jgi:hypothetical protein
MAETETHVLLLTSLINRLRRYFRGRTDVYAVGNIFLYYEEGNLAAVCSPDVMVVFGVSPTPPRRSFKTWVEGAVPSVIFELTSQGTRHEDQVTKRALYERLGVREYFLFDPFQEWLPEPLMGYRLLAVAENGEHEDPRDIPVRHQYEPMIMHHGRLASHELGLWVEAQGMDLVLTSMRTGERLLHDDDMDEEIRQSRQRAEDERRQAEDARRQAEDARRRAEDERERAEDASKRAEDERRLAEDARRLAEDERQRAQDANQRAEDERRLADDARRLAEDERQRANELARQQAATKEEADAARKEAEAQRKNAEAADERAADERRRADELECELARLRALLPPPPEGK